MLVILIHFRSNNITVNTYGSLWKCPGPSSLKMYIRDMVPIKNKLTPTNVTWHLQNKTIFRPICCHGIPIKFVSLKFHCLADAVSLCTIIQKLFSFLENGKLSQKALRHFTMRDQKKLSHNWHEIHHSIFLARYNIQNLICSKCWQTKFASIDVVSRYKLVHFNYFIRRYYERFSFFFFWSSKLFKTIPVNFQNRLG